MDERLRLREDRRRAGPAGRVLEGNREKLAGEVGDRDLQEEPRPPPPDGQYGRNHEPDQALSSYPRQGLEDRIEPGRPVVDNPALDAPVEGDQAGSSSLACSINCWGSKGFPTNPWAPRALASSAAWSLIFPLNMITGIAPTP
jgi:hypothetical protein